MEERGAPDFSGRSCTRVCSSQRRRGLWQGLAQRRQSVRIFRAGHDRRRDHVEGSHRRRLRQARVERRSSLHYFRDRLLKPARRAGSARARHDDPPMNSESRNRTRLAATVRVGQELPELVKEPTTRQLVQYAGAQGDFYEIHYDQDYARSVGLPGVILHGLLKAAFLAQLVTDWIGDEATLKTFGVSYRGIDVPAHPYRC